MHKQDSNLCDARTNGNEHDKHTFAAGAVLIILAVIAAPTLALRAYFDGVDAMRATVLELKPNIILFILLVNYECSG